MTPRSSVPISRAAQDYENADNLGKSTSDVSTCLGDIYTNSNLCEMAANCYANAMELNEKSGLARAIRAAKMFIAQAALQETRGLIDALQRLPGEQLSDADRKDLLRLRARLVKGMPPRADTLREARGSLFSDT